MAQTLPLWSSSTVASPPRTSWIQTKTARGDTQNLNVLTEEPKPFVSSAEALRSVATTARRTSAVSVVERISAPTIRSCATASTARGVPSVSTSSAGIAAWPVAGKTSVCTGSERAVAKTAEAQRYVSTGRSRVSADNAGSVCMINARAVALNAVRALFNFFYFV